MIEVEEALGIIAPHPPIMVDAVGGERAAATARSATAMQAARRVLDHFGPDALVLSSPHAPLASDGFLVRTAESAHGDLGDFGAPTVRFAALGDPELARAILARAAQDEIPAAGLEDVSQEVPLDHGVLVPLSFLDPSGEIPLVTVSLSFLSNPTHVEFGRAIRLAAEELGRRVAFVASGDLSHRLTRDAPSGFAPRAEEFDRQLVSAVDSGDLGALLDLDPSLVAEAGECGLRSFLVLAGFIDGTGATSRALHYEGPWGVGYLTALAATPSLLQAADGTPATGSKGGSPGDPESPPVALARRAIEEYVRAGRTIAVPDDPDLTRRAAAFVSLHRGPDLRGCIGTIEPSSDTLAEEIVTMAIQAASQDPRFPAVDPGELADLEISVDVLEPAEPIDDLADLDPARFGVIVSKDWRRGLLLPDLEGVDTAEQQVSIACRKAGISPDESVRLERFRVERFR